MDTSQQTESEAQEKAIKELSDKQREILKSAKLEMDMPTQGNIIIHGEIMIEGKPVSFKVIKSKDSKKKGAASGQDDVYFAKIDGRTIQDQAQSQKLFDFYYPILKATQQKQQLSTEEAEAIHIKQLFDKLLGE